MSSAMRRGENRRMNEMTRTVRTPEGRNAMWIEADYGQGRRGRARKVEWYRLSLAEYLEQVDLEALAEGMLAEVRKELLRFSGTGYAWQATDCDRSEIFETAKEARDWARSRDC